MNWWGKVLGAACGLVIGGPVGALVGVAVGHVLDRLLANRRHRPTGAAGREQVQRAFFTATFTTMGRVAKIDGRVSEDEIAFARSVMTRMNLDEAQKREAIRLFTEGKHPQFPLDAALKQFSKVCRGRHDLVRMFLEIQLQAAYADGSLTHHERQLLVHIFGRVGFSRREFEKLDAMVRVASHFTDAETASRSGSRNDSTTRERQTRAPDGKMAAHVREAYDVLGIRPAASESEVKRAYRRLMAQHHPDKLVAKGLPEEMVRLATEKTQEIKNAYEAVKLVRGIR